MKLKFLFPYWSRYLGYALIIIHIPVAAIWHGHGFHHENPPLPQEQGIFSTDHLFFMATSLMVTVGLFLVAFSKEKIEDEQISQLRLDSLQWAVFLNYLVLIVGLVFISNSEIKHVLQLNIWIPLIFFIVRFRWLNYRLNRSLN
jgi:hypothetical protein